MAIYRDDRDKLHMTLNDPGTSTVDLTVNCYNGTLVNAEAQDIEFRCGDTHSIGNAVDLKGSRVKVTGTPRNPEGGDIKVEHIFKSSNGTKTYTFPDDYTGSPAYDPEDENVTYIFYMNFD